MTDEATVGEHAGSTTTRWLAPLIVACLVLVGAGVGWTVGDDNAESEQVDVAEARAQAAEIRAARAIRDRDTEIERRRKIEGERASEEGALFERQKTLDATAAELASREQALTAAETEAEARRQANEFGNGVHEVGTDIQPGKYKTEGGEGCYWAKLKEDDDIIDNDIVNGPTTVTITTGTAKFKSSNCGTWTKVG